MPATFTLEAARPVLAMPRGPTAPARLLIVAWLGLFGCEPGWEVRHLPVDGPRGLQGLSGEIEGERIEEPTAGFLSLGTPYGWEVSQFGTEEWWFLAAGDGDTSVEAGGSAVQESLLRMPPGTPHAGEWLCAGEGSRVTDYGADGLEATLENLSLMGTCRAAPRGSYWASFAFAEMARSFTGSAELMLDGAYPVGIDCQGACAFSATSESGMIRLWVRADAEFEEAVPLPLREAALFLPNADGGSRLACAGGDSTITLVNIGMQDFEHQVELEGLSWVGACPGEPIEGSLVVRYYLEH